MNKEKHFVFLVTYCSQIAVTHNEKKNHKIRNKAKLHVHTLGHIAVTLTVKMSVTVNECREETQTSFKVLLPT